MTIATITSPIKEYHNNSNSEIGSVMIFIAPLGVLLIVICYLSTVAISNTDTDWAVLQQLFFLVL